LVILLGISATLWIVGIRRWLGRGVPSQAITNAQPTPKHTHLRTALAVTFLLSGMLVLVVTMVMQNNSARALASEHRARVSELQARTMHINTLIGEANAVAGRAASRAGNEAERPETRAQALEEQRDYERRAANLSAELGQLQAKLAAQQNLPTAPYTWRLFLPAAGGLALLAAAAAILARISWRALGVAAAFAAVVAILGLAFIASPSPARPRTNHSPPGSASARTKFPEVADVTKNGQSLLVHHDGIDPYYVLFAPHGSSSTVSDSLNTQSLRWLENGAVKIAGGRTFSYLRKSDSPDDLSINGQNFDLREGQVFVLLADGLCEQTKLFPSLAEAMEPQAIGKLVETATEMTTDPITQDKLRWQLEVARKQLETLLRTYAPEHPVVQECHRNMDDLTRKIALEPDSTSSTAPPH
jgi:hypothetical protein